MPGIGIRYEPYEPPYAGLRYYPITLHRKTSCLFRPVPGGIEVLRVLHGARDIQSILAEDFGGKDADDETADSE
jgi:toxin ParE1/3/4